MHLSRLLLASALLLSVASGCARRNKARTAPEATTVAPTPPPVVASTAARDLTDVMTETLQLAPEQQQKVRAILTSTAELANTAQRQYATNRPALSAELKRINASSEKQLQQVLTAAQYQKLKARQQELQAQMRSRRQ